MKNLDMMPNSTLRDEVASFLLRAEQQSVPISVRKTTDYGASLIVVLSALVTGVNIGETQITFPTLVIGFVALAVLLIFTPRRRFLGQSSNHRTVFALVTLLFLILWDQVRDATTYSSGAYWLPIAWAALLIIVAGRGLGLRYFVEAFWDAARILAIIALAGWAISIASGDSVLTNSWEGAFRAQGLSSEPSALAPLVAGGIILSLQKRDFFWLLLFSSLGIATLSPVVMIVTAISMVVFLFVRRFGLFGLVSAGIILFISRNWVVGVANDVATATLGWIEKNRADDILFLPVYRIASSYLQARGDASGWEDSGRIASRQLVEEVLLRRGSEMSGIGFGNDGVLAQMWTAQPNDLFSHFALAWGYPIAWILVIMFVWGVFARRREGDFPIFLAFLATALINSAGGWQLYGLILFGAVAPMSVPSVKEAGVGPVKSIDGHRRFGKWDGRMLRPSHSAGHRRHRECQQPRPRA